MKPAPVKATERDLEPSLRGLTIEGLLATPWVTLAIPGNLFMAALMTSVLGLSKSDYGIIVSLPAWFNALQLVIMPALERYFTLHRIMIWCGALNTVVWMALVLALPLLPIENPSATFHILLAYFAFISLTQALNAVSWTVWVQGWVPSRVRGTYFGRRNGLLGMCTVAFLLVAGWIVSFFDGGLVGYQVILAVAGLMRMGSVWKLSRIPMGQGGSPRRQGEWLPPLRRMFAVAPFRWFVLFGAALAFWLGFSGPFVPIFMADYLGLPVGRQAILLMLANLMAATFLPVWGRLMDRHGCKPVIIVSCVLWMVPNYAWAFLTREAAWVLHFMWLWGGAVSGGVILGVFSLLLKVVPKDMKSGAVSVNLMVTSVAAAFAPILGGLYFEASALFGLSTEMLFRVIFIVQPTMICLSLWLLRPLEEPQAGNYRTVLGALRSWRTTFVGSGYFVLGNWAFSRPRRNRDG
jgi:hypothetical protein